MCSESANTASAMPISSNHRRSLCYGAHLLLFLQSGAPLANRLSRIPVHTPCISEARLKACSNIHFIPLESCHAGTSSRKCHVFVKYLALRQPYRLSSWLRGSGCHGTSHTPTAIRAYQSRF